MHGREYERRARDRHDDEGEPNEKARERAAAIFAENIRAAIQPGDDVKQRHSGNPVEDGGIDQGLDRIDTDKIQGEADKGRHKDNTVETPRVAELARQALLPVERLGQCISRRS